MSKKEVNEVFDVAIDDKKFSQKPSEKEIGGISNRIVKKPKQMTLNELAKEILAGKSYLPCRLQQGKRRSKDNWERQNLFVLDIDEGMTLEEALEHDFICSHASFVHTTFSHSDKKHKFRIIFASNRDVSNIDEFDKIMDWLFLEIPQADKSCKDRARLFFAGNNIYWVDKANRLKVDEIISHTPWGDRKNNIDISPQSLSTTPKFRTAQPTFQSTRVEAIRNKDFQLLQSMLDREEVVLTKNQIHDYLKQIPLYEYLGIKDYKSFNDIFHDETQPSASIYRSNKQNGHWLYKCFSKSMPFSGTIIEVTMKLQGSTKQQALEFLMRVFKVKYTNQSAINYFSSLFNYYLEYMSGNNLTNQYPELYNVLTRSNALAILINLLAFVQNDINEKGTQIECYYSLDTLSKQFNISKTQLGKKMNLFNYLGFLGKFNDSEIDDTLLTHLEENRNDKNRKYRSSVYSFDILGVELLNVANERAKDYIAYRLTLNMLTHEGIARSFGVDRANEIFPQDINKAIPEEHDENAIVIVKVISQLIDLKGWATQKEIIETVAFNKNMSKTKKTDIFKIVIKQILDDYDLEYVGLTKEIKLSMKIDEAWLSKLSFPKIIRRK